MQLTNIPPSLNCPVCGSVQDESKLGDAEMLRVLLPGREVFLLDDLARFFGIDSDTVAYHAKQRPSRFPKSTRRWRWDGVEEVIPLCLFLIGASFKAKSVWKARKIAYFSQMLKQESASQS